MKFLIVFVALCSVALAAPTEEGKGETRRYEDDSPEAEALKNGFEISHERPSQDYRFVSSGDDAAIMEMKLIWKTPDGRILTILYDEDGNILPEGDQLPV